MMKPLWIEPANAYASVRPAERAPSCTPNSRQISSTPIVAWFKSTAQPPTLGGRKTTERRRAALRPEAKRFGVGDPNVRVSVEAILALRMKMSPPVSDSHSPLQVGHFGSSRFS